MVQRNTVSLHNRIALRAESVLMTYVVPRERVGGLFAFIFKIPLWLQKLGAERWIP